MTVMESLEIIASCDLKFGLYSKLNDNKVAVCSATLKPGFMFCAYTRR